MQELQLVRLACYNRYYYDRGKDNRKIMAEKCFTEINGVRMGMFIRSKDCANPVLLFVHGGPGMPEYFLAEDFSKALEDIFTVVYWDQRGAGLSFCSHIDKSTLTAAQYIEDLIAVTNYLRKRFGQEKIYLMAHSWGTYFGIQTVQKAPELYRAYIAVGQVTCQAESEKRAFQYMLDYFTKTENRKRLSKLKKNPCPSIGYFFPGYTIIR